MFEAFNNSNYLTGQAQTFVDIFIPPAKSAGGIKNLHP
jgi:hypothetical protein